MLELVKSLIQFIYTDHRSFINVVIAATTIALFSRKLFSREEKTTCAIVCRMLFVALGLIITISCELGVVVSVPTDSVVARGGTVMVMMMLKEVLLILLSICIFGIIIGILYRQFGIEAATYAQGMFLLCIIQFMRSGVFQIEPWSAGFYALDYSLGFSSRLFIGTLLKLMHPDILTLSMVNRFAICNCFLLAGVISVVLAICITKVPKVQKPACIYLALMYFFSPGSFYNIAKNLGRLELFGYIIVLLMAIWHGYTNNHVLLRYGGITAASVVLIMIHQGNLFLLFPSIFALLIFSQYQDEQWVKREVRFSVFTLFVICVTFLVVQFLATDISLTSEELNQYIQTRTGNTFAMNEEALHYEYYSTIFQTYESINKVFFAHDVDRELPWIVLTATIILYLPFLQLLQHLWQKQYATMNMPSKFAMFKNPIFYILLSFLSVVPQYFLNVDWARWLSAMCFVQFFLLFLMIYYNYGCISSLLAEASRMIVKYKYLAIANLIYMRLLQEFAGRANLAAAQSIKDKIMMMLCRCF